MGFAMDRTCSETTWHSLTVDNIDLQSKASFTQFFGQYLYFALLFLSHSQVEHKQQQPRIG